MSPRSLPLLGLAALLVLAPVSTAQLTEKQATKQYAQALKAETKALRGEVKAALADVLAAVGQIQAQVKVGEFGVLEQAQLSAALRGFRNDLQAAVLFSSVDATLELGGALSDMAGVELGMPLGLDGQYPDGFYFGDGGPFDDYRAAADDAVSKAVKKLDKRLVKLAKLLEKKLGIGFTHHLAFPGRGLVTTFADSGSAPSQANVLDVAYAYAYSVLDTPDDGVLVIAGHAPNTVDDVTLTLRGGADDLMVEQSVTPTTTGIGQPVWNLNTLSLPEGNYLLEVQRENGVDTLYLNLGVR